MASPDETVCHDIPDRSDFLAKNVVQELWIGLQLPLEALAAVQLTGDSAQPSLPSSFKIGILAQGTIALSALAAAQVWALRSQTPVPAVEVTRRHAVIEFKSERLYLLDGQRPAPSSVPIGGLHRTSDGHVRVHDGFPNHALGTLKLAGLPDDATREQLAERLRRWAAIDLETVSVMELKLANYALRTFEQWDVLPQAKAISNFPVDITLVSTNGRAGIPQRLVNQSPMCLKGVRVVEMSRVIAAPVAGKTLAAHGADVIWVTSPNLPDLPYLDREFSRGKRTVQLDLNVAEERLKLLDLIKGADIFIQGFRPGALAAYGLGPEDLAGLNPGLIIANLSAFGTRGPWAKRRGFDSLVQTCSGMNVSEAEHYGQGEVARPAPCQVLDHAAGYLLASGAMAALHRKMVQGGSWRVDVSLAGTMKYLRSLGQYPGSTGFQVRDLDQPDDIPLEYYELRNSEVGMLQSIRHSARIEGAEVGFGIMPKPLGSDEPKWL